MVDEKKDSIRGAKKKSPGKAKELEELEAERQVLHNRLTAAQEANEILEEQVRWFKRKMAERGL